jgi:hypothetical protein
VTNISNAAVTETTLNKATLLSVQSDFSHTRVKLADTQRMLDEAVAQQLLDKAYMEQLTLQVAKKEQEKIVLGEKIATSTKTETIATFAASQQAHAEEVEKYQQILRQAEANAQTLEANNQQYLAELQKRDKLVQDLLLSTDFYQEKRKEYFDMKGLEIPQPEKKVKSKACVIM